jgi:SAM-dependent methyltransferase
MFKRYFLRLLEKMGLLVPFFRLYERTKALNPGKELVGRQDQANTVAEGLPIPPPNLIVLVSGHANQAEFLESGRETADSILHTLRRNSLEIMQFDNMLDFGCGCGRILRYWHDHPGVSGCDYNQQLIDWCSQNLIFANYTVNGLSPPLEYEDETFDFIYSMSVFTHLPESLQFEWMAELRRVLKPGGYLLITTHGKAFLNRLNSKELASYQKDELVVIYEDAAGTNMCAAFHPKEYVLEKLAVNIELVDYVSEGAHGTGNQDIYLLAR